LTYGSVRNRQVANRIDGAFGVTIGGERGILLGLRAGEG